MKRIIICLALCALSCFAVAGPFGLDFGASAGSLSKLKLKKVPNQEFWYTTKTPPNPHNDFSEYRLLITPTHGLCRIDAFSSAVATDVYGEKLRSRFYWVKDALSKKYGDATEVDGLKPGSIWSEPRDYMTSLVKEERQLVAFWEEEAGRSDGVESLMLTARGLTDSSGLIALTYFSKDGPACMKLSQSKRDSSL